MQRKIVTCMAVLVLLGGCSMRMGQFTVASSQNVRNLHYSNTQAVHTEGKSCLNQFLGIPIGSMNGHMQIAMDRAIENGRSKGGKGDILVNSRIDTSYFTLIIWGQQCTTVSGDLVEMQSR